jgi:hypothetical protein
MPPSTNSLVCFDVVGKVYLISYVGFFVEASLLVLIVVTGNKLLISSSNNGFLLKIYFFYSILYSLKFLIF